MQNKTDDKQRNSMSGSVDRSSEKKNDSSKHGAHQGERSHERDHADQSPFRRDYDKDGSSSKPDDQSQRPQGGHSGQGQSQPRK
jgi:hypothetical protein